MPAYTKYTRSQAESISPSPPPRDERRSDRRRRPRPRRYSAPQEKYRRPEVTIVLCAYHRRTHGWRTIPLTFDPYRMTDEELWKEIRDIYRTQLQLEWRRIFLFRRLRHIVPIEFSRNDVPLRQDPKNVPNSHEFMHCYHHPDRIRTNHEWVDWFVEFERNPERTYGLEFVEGLWAEKLGLLAIAVNIVLIIVSIVWVIRGGNLQTVFTVMSFIITAVAADIALLALYYQITSPA